MNPAARTLTRELADLQTRVRALELRGDVGVVADRVTAAQTDLDIAEAQIVNHLIGGASRPMGTTGLMGTFVSGRRVRAMAGFTTQSTDPSGYITIGCPAGTVCVISILCQSLINAAGNPGFTTLIRQDGNSSIANGILVQARNLDTGVAMGSTALFMNYVIFFQGAD